MLTLLGGHLFTVIRVEQWLGLVGAASVVLLPADKRVRKT